jgi:hypothetical protein
MLVLAVAALLAQPAPAPPAPAANPIAEAAQAFGLCVGDAVQGMAATVEPDAAAAQALAACSAQRTRLEQVFESTIAAAPIPDEQKAAARAEFRSQIAGAQAQIAGRIRERRAGAATTGN